MSPTRRRQAPLPRTRRRPQTNPQRRPPPRAARTITIIKQEKTMGVLDGMRIVEIAGIGPGPFCGMLLADMGAQVTLVERAGGKANDPLDLGKNAIVHRGKRSLALDLKDPQAIDAVLRLIDDADAVIEGMRPGVMERLGLGPDVCLARNPRLVYGRMTRWRRRPGTTSTTSPCPARCGSPAHPAPRRWRRRRWWATSAAARCIWRWVFWPASCTRVLTAPGRSSTRPSSTAAPT